MRIFIVLLLVMLPPATALADVTGVSGTISDGQSITITGSDFGANGPNVIVFDDFEGGAPDESIATGEGSAKYGQWDNVAPGGSHYYGTTAHVSGSQSFTSDFSVESYSWIEALLPASTRNVFISWWIYIPAGNNFVGEGHIDGINWKQMWIQGADTSDDDLSVPTQIGSTAWYITRNEQDPAYGNWTTVDFNKGEWKRLWAWVKGSTTSTSEDGEVKFWEMTSSGVVQRENDIGVNLLKETGAFERVRPNGYGRQPTSNCIASFDDVYIAAGPYAQARVEMGNAATYNESTKLAILTPTAWADGSITATVNQGSFSADETAYIYVTDADGTVNANGYQVTIGGEEDPPSDTTPPVRSNGSPSGQLASGTTQTTMSLTTDEAATCRWSESAGTAYASMSDTFSTTGETSHSNLVTGLEDGGSYSRYVRCIDGEGNANTTDYAISWSVAEAGVPPERGARYNPAARARSVLSGGKRLVQ
jgi:hypothetical protein